MLLQFDRVDIDTAIINYAEWTTALFMFLLINLLAKRPHDCFRCLNKNPAVIYSLYQYPDFYIKGRTEKRIADESSRSLHLNDNVKFDNEVII